MKNKLLFVLLVALSPAIRAQEQIVKGKVVSETNPVAEVLVVNINKEKEVRTNNQGLFTITAQAGDTIFVVGAEVMPLKFAVSEDNLKRDIVVEVTIASHYQLEEVIVEKDNRLTSEGLGLVPEGQKRYTPQERKLYTAGDFKAYHLLGILGGRLPVDPILNAINGRTNMLKKSVAVERKETALEALNRMFTDEEMVIEFKIPQEHVQGFYFYCVEDAEFAAAVKAENETLVKFLMNKLAINYVTLINENTQNED